MRRTLRQLRILDRRYAAIVFLILLIWWGWPATTKPLYNDDSLAYLNWPQPLVVDGLEVMGARPPIYPLLLKIVGVGPRLLHLQTWFSLACWSLLGWMIGRTPGLVTTGLLALCPAISFWNLTVLTESLTLSLLALLVGLGILLPKRASLTLFLTWCLAIVVFGFLRDSNLLLLPFLLLPALHHSRQRRFVAIALVCVVMVGGAAFAQQQRHWVIPYYNAIDKRILPDPAARLEFEAAGMPAEVFRDQAREFKAWFLERGQVTYQRWVLTRPASYWEAGRNLVRPNQSSRLQELYFESFAGFPRPWVSSASETLFRALAWPLPIAVLLLLIPGWEVLRRGRIGGPAGWILVLALGIYVQAFATFHGDGVEIERHMLPATILYRIGLLLILAHTATLLRRLRQWRKDS